MHIRRQIIIAKIVMILLIILFVALNFQDCQIKAPTSWGDVRQVNVYPSATQTAGMVIIVAAGALQCLLIACNRFVLQVIPGAVCICPAIMMPLNAFVQNKVLGSIQYIRDPGYTNYEWQVTPAGYGVAAFACLMLILDICAAWWLCRKKERSFIAQVEAQEREEVAV